MALPDLDQLIAEVDRTCPSTDWIERLKAAAEVAGRLQVLGEDLVTEYVEHAKFASRSWNEIGDALGVSRQAAQQRFQAPHRHFDPERFTEELQAAMPLIKEAAVTQRHNYVGLAHVLLGITAQANSATALLESHSVDVEVLRRTLRANMTPGASQAAERIAWTPYARRAIQLADEAASGTPETSIGTDHMLIGIVRLGRGSTAEALRNVGITSDALG